MEDTYIKESITITKVRKNEDEAIRIDGFTEEEEITKAEYDNLLGNGS